jgi:hypothetical protein
VIETRVFDHTAIIALFQGSTPAFRVWQAAEDDKLTLILPAVAVAEANGVIGADSNAWRAILDPGRSGRSDHQRPMIAVPLACH